MTVNGGPTPTSRTLLEQLWRRIDRSITEKIDQAIVNRLGGLVKGGYLNAQMLYGSIPAREVVHNATGGSLTKGQAVYVTGDSSGLTTVAKARANADATMPAVGIMAETVANAADGVMTKTGRLDGIDTSAWSVGTLLYVSSSTAGALTSTAPSPRAQIVAVVIIQNATTGAIEVLAGSTSKLIDHVHTATGDGGAVVMPDVLGTTTQITEASLGSGNVNNWNPGGAIATTGLTVRISTASAACTITGIVAPTAPSTNRFLVIVNDSGFDFTIANDSASSTGGNRIQTGTGADLTFPYKSALVLYYESHSVGFSTYRVVGMSKTAYFDLPEISAPATPATDHARLYVGTDGATGISILKQLNDSGAIIQHGQELYVIVDNSSGGAINTGEFVYAAGWVSSTIPSVAKARANALSTVGAFGCAAATIASGGAKGLVMVRGMSPANYNTNSGSVGAPAWLSTSTAGAIQDTEPTPSGTSAYSYPVGRIIVTSSSGGRIYVNPFPGFMPAHDHSGQGQGSPIGNSGIASGAEIDVAKLADGDALQVIRTATDGTSVEWGPAPLVKLAETVLGATAASIDFTSIPATYRHLLLAITIRKTTADGSYTVRLNNDSGANYTLQQVSGSAAAATAVESLAATSWGFGGIPSTANYVSNALVIFPDYAGSLYKTFVQLGTKIVGVSTGNLVMAARGGIWLNTAAINRITLTPDANNFDVGSTVTIYGLPI